MASRDRRERRDGEDGPSESVNITALQTALVGAVSSVWGARPDSETVLRRMLLHRLPRAMLAAKDRGWRSK